MLAFLLFFFVFSMPLILFAPAGRPFEEQRASRKSKSGWCVRRVRCSGPHPAAIHLQRSGITFAPAAPNLGQEMRPMLIHLRDESPWRSRFLVPRAPHQKFKEHGREIDSFLRELVNDLSFVDRIRFRNDDSGFAEFAKAMGQDVAGNAFAGFLKLLERAKAANHQVADNEQSPAVAEYFQ
jgi:hypothetical protein